MNASPRLDQLASTAGEALTSLRVRQAVLDDLDGSLHLLVAADVQLDDLHAFRLKLLQLLCTLAASILSAKHSSH